MDIKEKKHEHLKNHTDVQLCFKIFRTKAKYLHISAYNSNRETLEKVREFVFSCSFFQPKKHDKWSQLSV